MKSYRALFLTGATLVFLTQGMMSQEASITNAPTASSDQAVENTLSETNTPVSNGTGAEVTPTPPAPKPDDIPPTPPIIPPTPPIVPPTTPTKPKQPRSEAHDRVPHALPVDTEATPPTNTPNYDKAPGRMTISDTEPHFIGHRFYEKKAGGWGWIRKPNESWRQARWVALQETPKRHAAPHRAYSKLEADHNFQYKLLGKFADYQVYDPHRDEMMDVFIIEGYEVLGLQPELKRKPGPPDRFRSRKSGAFTRGGGRFNEDNDF